MNARTTPTESQLDALLEMTHVGAGQAATALSRLLGGRRVGLVVPRALVLPLCEVPALLGGAQAPVVAVAFGMNGALEGRLLLALPTPHARRLAEALLGGVEAEEEMGAAERSALAEVANILGSACLTAIGRLTGLVLLPTPPTLEQDAAQAVVRRALLVDVAQERTVVVLEARFQPESAEGMEGQLLLILEGASLGTLLARLGV